MSLTAKLALSPVLVTQALLTRRRLPVLQEAAGDREGVTGRGGRELRLLVAGDSSAAGMGVATQREALADPLARRLAELGRLRVRWSVVARSGVTSAQAFDMLRDAVALHGRVFDVAVLALGVNDVVDQVPSQRAVAARERIANLLRNRCGVQHVVFCPLPPVHRFPGLPQPLRWIAGADARRHDAAVARWAAERSDVSHVPIDYDLAPAVMAADGFHPGAPVYRACALALAGHIAGSLLPGLHLPEAKR